jgi:hypothetical protein
VWQGEARWDRRGERMVKFSLYFVDSFFQNEISCETVSPNYESSKLDLMLIGFEILFFVLPILL